MNEQKQEVTTKQTDYNKGFVDGLKEAVIEVRGWRELCIKAHQHALSNGGYQNNTEASREHQNQLNLLGVIESKLRTKAGEDKKAIFKGV